MQTVTHITPYLPSAFSLYYTGITGFHICQPYMDLNATGENINAIQERPVYDDYTYKDYPSLVQHDYVIISIVCPQDLIRS